MLRNVTYCYVLLRIVTYCYVLLRIVTYCYVLLRNVTYCYVMLRNVTYCYVLLRIVTYCYVLLRIVTYCYVLLRIVTQLLRSSVGSSTDRPPPNCYYVIWPIYHGLYSGDKMSVPWSFLGTFDYLPWSTLDRNILIECYPVCRRPIQTPAASPLTDFSLS